MSPKMFCNANSAEFCEHVSVCVCSCVSVYLFDGGLSYLVRVLPDALQEVSQLRHGRVPDLRPQLGDVFRHNGAETILTRPGKTCLLQLLQRPQRWVVPNTHTHIHTYTHIHTHTHTHTHTRIQSIWKGPLNLFIQSYGQLISYELNLSFRLRLNLSNAEFDFVLLPAL